MDSKVRHNNVGVDKHVHHECDEMGKRVQYEHDELEQGETRTCSHGQGDEAGVREDGIEVQKYP
jgi:hypothetical protein